MIRMRLKDENNTKEIKDIAFNSVKRIANKETKKVINVNELVSELKALELANGCEDNSKRFDAILKANGLKEIAAELYEVICEIVKYEERKNSVNTITKETLLTGNEDFQAILDIETNINDYDELIREMSKVITDTEKLKIIAIDIID